MLRIIKILLILAVALWGLIAAYGNVIDWNGTMAAVQAATSMSTFDPVPASAHATSNPVIVLLGALFITLSKMATGVLCLLGAWQMWTARNRDTATFARATTWALTGCGVAVFMLFAGFIVIAETWYELWRSPVMLDPVLGSAFRYCGMIGVIALFVGTGEK